jgi:hypothetical protein
MKQGNSWREAKCEEEDVRCWILDVGKSEELAAEARKLGNFELRILNFEL